MTSLVAEPLGNGNVLFCLFALPCLFALLFFVFSLLCFDCRACFRFARFCFARSGCVAVACIRVLSLALLDSLELCAVLALRALIACFACLLVLLACLLVSHGMGGLVRARHATTYLGSWVWHVRVTTRYATTYQNGFDFLVTQSLLNQALGY